MKTRYAVLAAALLLSLPATLASAQATGTPAAPTPQIDTAPPSAPAAAADPLPPANPKFFTAASPTVDTVNAFLRQVWGYDTNRLYRVMAIQKTSAPGVIKVVVFVLPKGGDPNKVQAATFYITPDGKHAIGEGAGVVPFGPTPFAETRDMLKARADGASRGAAGKDLELVEFADLQCPHCKEAQSTMDQIVKDFPKAHIVFQLFPLVDIHPSAFKAAAYGVCAQKQSNEAFFKYADGVFETQEALAPTSEDTLLKAAAMRAGLDGAAIAACSETQATKDIVNADIKLAEDAGVDQTPLLSVNGRLLPLTGVSYEGLKKMIQYQATLDGVDSGATAETLAPKPPQPTLQTLPK
ncbi:MAG TPA: DsbA family protein [Acidobacteriaceae bacterium]